MKRVRTEKSSKSQKRTKLSHAAAGPRRSVAASALPWKKLSTDAAFLDDVGFDAEGGMLGLEEIEGVDVVFGDQVGSDGLKTVQFLVPENSKLLPVTAVEADAGGAADEEEEWVPLPSDQEDEVETASAIPSKSAKLPAALPDKSPVAALDTDVFDGAFLPCERLTIFADLLGRRLAT